MSLIFEGFSAESPRACHRPHLAVEQIVAARVAVYAGNEDQYYAYCTPEAYNALKGWMDYRQTSGEKITGKSWIMITPLVTLWGTAREMK
jgi:hypothetical protein